MSEENETESTEIIGESAPIENAEPPTRRARGRPPKNADEKKTDKKTADSGPKKRKSTTKDDNAKLAGQLVGIHLLVAQFTGIQEAVISDAEALMLAEAVNSVCDQYDLAIDGKTGAAIQLFAAASVVYAPRVFHYHARQRAKSTVVEGEFTSA